MITITGLCLGVKKVQKDPTKDPIFSIGIATKVKGGFDNQTETTEIRLDKDQVMSGYIKVFDELKGKAVCVPFRTSSNLFNDRVYTNHYCQGEPLKQHTTLPKAG